MHLAHVKTGRFECLRDESASCQDFSKIYKSSMSDAHTKSVDYIIHDGYYFKDRRLCIPSSFLKDFVICKLHAMGAAGAVLSREVSNGCY